MPSFFRVMYVLSLLFVPIPTGALSLSPSRGTTASPPPPPPPLSVLPSPPSLGVLTVGKASAVAPALSGVFLPVRRATYTVRPRSNYSLVYVGRAVGDARAATITCKRVLPHRCPVSWAFSGRTQLWLLLLGFALPTKAGRYMCLIAEKQWFHFLPVVWGCRSCCCSRNIERDSVQSTS